MITDNMIKTEFIHTIVTRDINRIYDTQEEVIRENLQIQSGNLLRFISRHPVQMAGSGLKPVYYMRVLSYLRFLDIQYKKQDMFFRRKLALYNRVVWGVLYNETLQDIKYGFSSEIRKLIRADLEKNGALSSGTIESIIK